METQQARRLQVVPTRAIALAVAVFVALMLAGSFGYWLKGLSNGPAITSTAQLGAVGSEQIAHNRSEEGLGSSSSVGGQQVAHDRDEQGLAH